MLALTGDIIRTRRGRLVLNQLSAGTPFNYETPQIEMLTFPQYGKGSPALG